MAGQEDSNGCINYEGGRRREAGGGGWDPRLPPAATGTQPLPLSLPFFAAFVKHIMAS